MIFKHSTWWITLCLAWTILFTPHTLWAEGDPENGKTLYAVCLACHGPDGAGSKELNSPRIAGQEIWYLERQLKNFKAGIRGVNINDTYGKQMQPFAMTLPTDQAIADVAAYVNSMKPEAPTPEIKGDANAGKAAYMICQACHGSKGEGIMAVNAPKLINQQDWYMIRQLKGFKEGLRGTHTNDIYGMQMRPMAMTLTDDAAINNVVSYITTFKQEQQVIETTDLPSEYMPSVIVSIVLMIGLTLIGLKVGRKKVDVR